MKSSRAENLILSAGTISALGAFIIDERAHALQVQLDDLSFHLSPNAAFELNNWKEFYNDVSLASLCFSAALLLFYYQSKTK